MSMEHWGFWLTIAGIACWPICFFWMHRISSRQDELLKKLGEQTARIEELSRTEHDLIKEVHPQVGEIRANLQAVADTVGAESNRANPPPPPRKNLHSQ